MGWSSGRLFKALFGVLALVLVIRLMLVGGLETAGGTSTTTMVKTRPDQGSFKRVNQKDLNHVSKRRIPNGPDPIHNRRAGNSGAPPNQV
ncbi:CLAVATA3/ESR (CLE)-related protein 25-like [Rhododendron vialii]|uniref:CLAVATA3/ESR (CLE)-related protein 25-like n=1 Tax=Rhododendron vialii TaxID=182163 RepID=UPI00265EC330|nr:CLAVATA3/ESR (CLE)-related protein 25-like [Rhododendron vialii]